MKHQCQIAYKPKQLLINAQIVQACPHQEKDQLHLLDHILEIDEKFDNIILNTSLPILIHSL